MNNAPTGVPQNASDNIKLARSSWRAGNYARAVSILDNAVKILGESTPLFVARADLEESRRRLPAVIENLKAAIVHAAPAEQASIQKRLAYVLHRHGQNEAARQVLADAGLIDRPTIVRDFPDDLRLEIYPVRVDGEPVTFLDHDPDLDVALVKSSRAILSTHDAGLSWKSLVEVGSHDITAGFVVSNQTVLLYDSMARELRLQDDQGNVLATHVAQVPWHGSWGIGKSGSTVIYAEYDLRKKYRGHEDQMRRVYRSGDGGRTWKSVHEVRVGGMGIRHFHTVQPDPYTARTWYLSSGDAAKHCRVWRSSDDGQTWSEVTDPDVRDQRLYRFTSVHFNKDAIYWGTDDQLGVGGAQAVKAERGAALKLQTLGSLGPEKCRVIINTPFGLMTISQAKEADTRTHICLIDAHDRITRAEPIQSPTASGVTFSVASRRAVHGRFFVRGVYGSFGDQTGTYICKLNRNALLQASDKCNVCSELLASTLDAPDGEAIVAHNMDAKLWNAFQLNSNETVCPTCLHRARTRTFLVVYRRFVGAATISGPALTVSASSHEYKTISRHFSPVQNVSLYRSDQFINCLSDVDITAMPQVTTGSYVFAFAMNVLDYIENVGGALREMWRILRPAGTFIFFIMPYRMVEGDAPPRVAHRNALAFNDKYGRRGDGSTGIPTCVFSTGWITREAKAAGFNVESVRIKDPFSDVRHIWWICRKPH